MCMRRASCVEAYSFRSEEEILLYLLVSVLGMIL